jgi:hypothetical protein
MCPLARAAALVRLFPNASSLDLPYSTVTTTTSTTQREEPHRLDASVSELLVLGGDDRTAVNLETGLNSYGCAPWLRPETVPLGTCTGSSPSTVAINGAEAARRTLHAAAARGDFSAVSEQMYESIREDLAEMLVLGRASGTQIALTASGTDAEYLATLLCLRDRTRALCNIAFGPSDAGSGSAVAAGWRHFNSAVPTGERRVKGTPIDNEIADLVDIWTLALRHDDGALRAPGEIDREARHVVERALERDCRVLLHVVAHSKTAMHAPSLGALADIRRRYPDRVDVLVDAAQGRFSRRGLAEVLQLGYLVLVTGSKFYGGPPFAGALLIPPGTGFVPAHIATLPTALGDFLTAGAIPRSWAERRRDLPDRPNVGLLLRWSAAVAEMRRYYAVPGDARYRVLRAYESMVPRLFAESPAIELQVFPPLLADDEQRVLQSKTTVYSFHVRRPDGSRIPLEGLLELHRWLNVDASRRIGPDATEAERRIARRSFHLGQPVALGAPPRQEPAVLRLALGGPLICDVSEDPRFGATLDERLAWLEDQILALRRKIELLAATLAC